MNNIKLDNLKLSDEEIKSIEKIEEFIKNRNVKELQEFNVREEIVNRVYLDAKSMKAKSGEATRKAFIKEYDEIYKKSENSILRTAFGKKWSSKFHYDYDASLYANYVYWKTNFPSEECPIIHIKSYLYIINGDDDMKYRGDTMNSWSTTLNEFMRQYGGEYFYNLKPNNKKKWIYKSEDEKSCKSWEEFLSNSANYKEKTLPKCITEFMDVVYTIGNFIPVPREPVNFNMQRNVFTKDYWDLTLLAIYEYYMGAREYTSLLSFLLGGEEIENWFKQFGSGEGGWNKFVEKNFMQSFVEKIGKNKYGRPYELWDKHFEGNVLPEKEEQFIQFFVNARVRILERGECIAKKLLFQNESETEISII